MLPSNALPNQSPVQAGYAPPPVIPLNSAISYQSPTHAGYAPPMSAPPGDETLLVKGLLFKNSGPNVAAGAGHLQKSFADFSECNTDLTVNHNKLSEAQASLNRSVTEYQKQVKFHDGFPALRESQMKAQQLAQATLQARERVRDQMLGVHEQQITTLINSLYKSGHIDPRAFEDAKSRLQGLDDFARGLDREGHRLDKENGKIIENQNVIFTKLSGLQKENAGQRDRLVALSKELTGIRSDLDQEKENQRSLKSGFSKLEYSQEQLLKDREEVQALKADHKKMLGHLQEMQVRLAQMPTQQATAGSQGLEDEEKLAVGRGKTNENLTKIVEISERVDILWSVVVGDEEKQQTGILDEMRSIAHNIRTELNAEIKTESKTTDDKVDAAQRKIKQEFNEMFTNDLNTNLNPLEERLDKIEAQPWRSLHGDVSLEDIKKDFEQEQKINHEMLTMEMESVRSRMIAAENDQRRHTATLRVDVDRLRANLEQVSSQRPISAPQSKASSPTPPYGQANVMQKIERMESVLGDHKEQLEELVSERNLRFKKTIKRNDERLEESKSMTHVSESVSKLITLVFGPSFDIEQNVQSIKPLIERIDALTESLPLIRNELESEFNKKHEEHANIFHEFSENARNKFRNSGFITSEPTDVDPLKALTEVPAALKNSSKNRPLVMKPIANGISKIQSDQGTARSPGSMSPASALRQTATPKASNSNSNSPGPSGDNAQCLGQATGQHVPPPDLSSTKGAKRQSVSAGQKRSIPGSATPSAVSTPQLQPTGSSRKRGHILDSESNALAAKKNPKHPKLSAKSPRKPQDPDPAAYEDPEDKDYTEGEDEEEESIVASQSSRHTRRKASKAHRPDVFDVPLD